MGEKFTDAPPPFTGTEIHTLSNGLTVILKEDHLVPVVSLQLWVKCGAVNEQPSIYGISHGLEHMVFKGTPTRSAGEISMAIEGQGGAMNAATQLETTHYYIDVPSNGAQTALEILADTILHPTFPPEELERERLVILEEIHSRDDSPDATLWDEYIAKLFQNTAYGIKVIGSSKTVSSLTQKDLFDYFKQYYVPSNKCFIVIGDFDTPSMLDKIKSLFEGEKSGTAPNAPVIGNFKWEPTHQEIRRPVQLSRFAYGRPTEGMKSDDLVALDVLSDLLGGGASSRFYHSLREEKQAVLSFNCDYTAFEQHGLFSFFGETQPEKQKSAIQQLKDEINQFSKIPITDDELKRSKRRLKSEWLHGTETPRGQASFLGSFGVFKRTDIVRNYLREIDALSPEKLMNVFQKILQTDQYSLTEVIPQN